MLRSRSSNCHIEPIKKVVADEDLEGSAVALLGIVGMGCPTCATRVRNSLLSRPGVLRVDIDLVYGLGKINYDPALSGQKELLEAVAEAGGDGTHVYQAIVIAQDEIG